MHDMPREWAAEDLALLPDDGHRYEIVDGSLYMSPPPTVDHQLAAARLHVALLRAVPRDVDVLENVGIQIGRSLLVPDVVAMLGLPRGRRPKVLEPRDTLLVAEVVSPSSVRMDRLMKPTMYAEAGIPAYLRVELDGPADPKVVVHRLVEGCYETAATVVAGEEASFHDPFDFTICPAELT
jgi:Uma2 family endonuclease